MKKIAITGIALLFFVYSSGQSKAVEDMFNKYSEKKGFTTVYISSKLLGLFAGNKTEAENNIAGRLTSIRILSVEDSLLNKSINFYQELSGKSDLSAYEELMVVKEGSNTTKFLIRQKGDIISELIVVTGGPGDNSLISITGNLDLKMISDLSKSTGIDELRGLEGIDKESP